LNPSVHCHEYEEDSPINGSGVQQLTEGDHQPLVRKREGPLSAAGMKNNLDSDASAYSELTEDEEQFLRFLQEESSHSFSYAPSAVPSKAGTTGAPTASPSKSRTKSPSKSPIKSPTQSPIKSPTQSPIKSPSNATPSPTRSPIDASSCVNDSDWNWLDSPKVTCKWIRNDEDRRQKFCPRPGVVDACPQACGVCCENDLAYAFTVNGVSRDCAWISTTALQSAHCGTRQNGRMIRDACPVACDRCQNNVTPAPSPSTPVCLNDDTWNWFDTDVVTCKWIRNKEARRKKFCPKASVLESCPQSCGICCEDDPSYKFKVNDKNRSCSWVGDKNIRKSKYCDTFQNGNMVRNACPYVCGACLTTV